MLIITKSSGRGRTKWNQVIFCDTDAHIKSRAAYLLLKSKLTYLDEDYISELDSLWKWLDFREEFLLEQQAEMGGNLQCHYCPKDNLEIGGKRPEDLHKNNKNKNLATVDHIHAVSEGGNKYDKKNMVVACKKCNGKKGSKSYEQFVNERKRHNQKQRECTTCG